MQQTLVDYKIADGKVDPVQNRSYGLDLARSIAIIFVIVAHFVNQLHQFGYWGVELFFALSGFLIGQILWRSFSGATAWNTKKITNFWARRWWRTLPNYYLFFVVSLFFHYYVMKGISSLSRLSNFIFFTQDLLHRGGEFFGVSWSLCIEEWFYFLFPLILYIIHSIIPEKRKSYVITIIIFFTACFVVREVLIKIFHETTVREITLARLDAIACGVLISYLFTTRNFDRKKQLYLFLSGLTLLFIICLIRVPGNNMEPILLLLTPLGFSFLLPLMSNLRAPGRKYNFFSNIIQKISLWSYSIYLSHIPILFTVYKLMSLTRNNTYGNGVSKLIALVITLLVSSTLYKYYELPLTKKRPKEVKK